MVFPTAMMRRASQNAAAETHLSVSAPSVPDEISIALDQFSMNRVHPTGLLRRRYDAGRIVMFDVESRSFEIPALAWRTSTKGPTNDRVAARRPVRGALLPPSVMQFYSGASMHFLSGVYNWVAYIGRHSADGQAAIVDTAVGFTTCKWDSALDADGHHNSMILLNIMSAEQSRKLHCIGHL